MRLTHIASGKPVAFLERWKFYPSIPCLVGIARHHADYPTPHYVETSRVLDIDSQIGIAETANTVYFLGAPA